MPLGPLGSPKELGFYLALSQVGGEMVAPIITGAVLDHYLRWGPWGVVVGALLGFVVGLVHLVVILNRQEQQENTERRESQ